MKEYRKRKDIIRAVQFRGDEYSLFEMREILQDQYAYMYDGSSGGDPYVTVTGNNHKGIYLDLTVELDEWLVVRGDGKFEVLDPESFESVYVEDVR
jgi:hypothetical protein